MPTLIKIYGERNTNTKYISQVVRLNLKAKELPGVVPFYVDRMQKLLPGNEWLRDVYFHFTYRYNLGWKHTLVKPIEALKNYAVIQNNNLFILTITKNPCAWLLSLHRTPYCQYYKKKPDFETFLQSPWNTVGRDKTKKVFKNPVELWNVSYGMRKIVRI